MGAKHMKGMSSFHPMDIPSWPNAEAFHYYTQIAPTTYSVNVSMDVSVVRRALKEKGYKFFPAYVYLVTRAICKQQALRTAVHEGVLGFWDSLTPAYPQLNNNTKTTSLLWTAYNTDFPSFYNAYIEDTTQHADSTGILSTKGLPPPNAYIISCIPWFTFNSFSLHNHGIKDYFFPSFEAGGFSQVGEKINMPLSVTVHHATTDGYHLSVFFDDLQQAMHDPEEWLL